jgi:hypothetical protein
VRLMEREAPRSPFRLKTRGFGLAALTAMYIASAACGAEGGCTGCTGEPIPGGFPPAKQDKNGAQVRLSKDGITFIEKNLDKLVSGLLPGDLSFPIPPQCSGSQKVCCNQTCTADLSLDSVDITPGSSSRLAVDIRASVKTSKIRLEQDLFIYTLKCDVTFDTSGETPNTVGLGMNLDLVIDPAKGDKLAIKHDALQVRDFQCGDLTISGGFDCTLADWLCPLFRGSIESALIGPMQSAFDSMLGQIPTGSEGRYDISGLIGSVFPGKSAAQPVDMAFWAGGYAVAEVDGVSAGVLTGFEAVNPSACVPSCEGVGATCQPPTRTPIARSPVFSGNTRPDGKPFHVGFGLHRQAIDRALYAFYKGGAICLDIGTELSTQLNSGLFSLLLPSINKLTAGKTVPMLVGIRPRQPPKVTLGKGTFHQGPDGNVIIDEPLLSISADNVGVDVYALIEKRYLRLFTVVGKLDVPLLLYVDANGALQPVVGDLSSALTNVKVENNDLLAENPAALEALFPTLLGLAAGALSSGFAPIELPSFSGLALELDDGSILSVDNNQLLAIFAKLAVVQSTSGSLTPHRTATSRAPRVDTRARIDTLSIPQTERFVVSRKDFNPQQMPSVQLSLDAVVPPTLATKPLEFSVAIDGGFYRPWTSARQLTFRDPLLWLQGHHTLSVKARLAGLPFTADSTPQVLRFVIDTVAPTVRLVRTESGVKANVEDYVSAPGDITLEWVVNGKRLSDRGDSIAVSDRDVVELRATDEAGNATTVTRRALTLPVEGRPDPLTSETEPSGPAQPGQAAAGFSGGSRAGCRIDGSQSSGGPGTLSLLFFLAVLSAVRRKRDRH